MTLDELFRAKRSTYLKKVQAFVKTPSTAEDIVQEAFVRALEKSHQYNPKKGGLGGWFYKILMSCLWNHLREVKKLPQHIDVERVLNLTAISHLAEDEMLAEIDKIGVETRRDVLVGYLFLGYSYKELASLFDLTQDGVRKIVQRFRDEQKKG